MAREGQGISVLPVRHDDDDDDDDDKFKYILSNHHHQRHGLSLARISLTLSLHSSLSSIALGRSSMRDPVSVQSCCG